jgi:hypothetical protein
MPNGKFIFFNMLAIPWAGGGEMAEGIARQELPVSGKCRPARIR